MWNHGLALIRERSFNLGPSFIGQNAAVLFVIEQVINLDSDRFLPFGWQLLDAREQDIELGHN